MKEATRQILEILERAVESERHFQREYSKGASLTEDPEIKAVFLKLVDDEMEHERILLERYQMLKGEPLVLQPESLAPVVGPGWEHDITVHTLEEIQAARERLGYGTQGSQKKGPAFFCDQQGVCLFDDVPEPNVEALKTILDIQGADGWELVQLDYRRELLICTWRRNIPHERESAA